MGACVRFCLATAARQCSLLIFAVAIAGCSKPGPSTDNLSSAIAQNTGGMIISAIKCESYANNTQEGTGRASCKGTLSLAEDHYNAIPQPDVASLLVGVGIPQTGTVFFLMRHPQQIYTRVAGKGDETAFSSECDYQKSVDAWNVGCQTNYQQFAGQPLSALGENPIIKGTPEFDSWIGAITSDFRQLDQAYRAVESNVKAFFAPGKTITLQDWQTHQPWYRARITAPLTWQGDPGALGHQGYFSAIVKYQDLRERTNQTLCGYPRGQPMDDLLVTGTIEFSPGSPQGPFVAKAGVVERNGLFNNSFTGCGGPGMPWNGSSFGLQTNNSLELVSK